MIFDNMPSALPHIKGGKLRALGVTGLKRSSALPDVPTIAETGVAGYDSLSWSGFAVPAGTPAQVIQRINSETARILETSEMRAKLAEQGGEAIGGSPGQFAEHIRAERAKWGRLIRERNLALD
jgi:tripartite-type tricarboxylate transporter receptor subunit TctC